MEEKSAAAPQESFRVVLASVTNLLYPVDIDLIHYLFSKYGEIEKIVTFSKSPTMYQALIQFQTPEQARLALMNLHSRNIYDGCNTLQTQPSRLTELVVKSNTQKCWDYTVQSGGPSGAANATSDLSQPQVSSHGGLSTSGVNNGRNVGPSGNVPPHHTGAGPHGAAGPYGAGAQHPSPMSATAVANMQPPPPTHAMGHHAAGASVHQGVRLGGAALGMGHPYHHGSNLLQLLEKLPRALRDLNIEATNPTQTPVIIVYNLPANVTVQMLFNLFSLYGSVLRVKILREKSDTALIQYSDPLYATIALNYIQGANVLGQSLQVCFSKYMEVKLPPPNSQKTEATAEEKRTVAFSIKDQRYGGDDVEKYVKGCCRPTKTIFVANLDECATGEEVEALFKEHGQVSKFTFKAPKSETAKTQMAMMEMGTEAEAVCAVMYLHNHELHGRSMKVAFSKTVL